MHRPPRPRVRLRTAVLASVLVGLLAVPVPAAAATEAWPGEPWQQAVNLTALDVDLTHDLSGAHWNPLTRTLWLAQNAGLFWALVEDGAGSFRIATVNGKAARWSPGGDLESIAQADLAEAAVYVLNEAGSLIRKYDTTTPGVVKLLREWNLAAWAPASGGSGAEGLAFVPDEWLVASGFVDGSGAPYTSRHGMGGLWFVAHQSGGYVYGFDLGAADATVELVGKYVTSRGESSGLEFDRTSGKLFIWHNTGSNYLELTDLRSFVRSDGQRQLVTLREYLGPRTGNLEGVALAAAGDGEPWYFMTDDDNQDGAALLWFRQFRPAQVGRDAFTVEGDQPLTVPAPGVRWNDSGTAAAAVLVSAPTHGTLGGLSVGASFAGGFTYVPAAGFAGVDTFTYKADDGVAGSEVATVTLTVLPRAGIDVLVSSGADDVEEVVSTGAVTLTSSDLELGEDASAQLVGIRFASVPVPRGATITAAWVQFTVDETGATATPLAIQGLASDASAPFSAVARDVSRRARTAAAVSWSPAAWTALDVAGPAQRTPDLSAVVQEIVDRPGWREGNPLALLVTGSGRRTARAHESGAAKAARLHVEFDEPETPLPSPTRVAASVVHGSDDAEEYVSTGAVNLSSSDLELVEDSSAQVVGVRFASLDVPPDVVVTAAWLQLGADETGATATTLSIHGELALAATRYTAAARDISSRPRTGAWVEWTPPAWATVDERGPAQQSPDLSAVVQEIVDQPGWAAGNPLAFVVGGSGKRTARAFESGAAKAATLYVEYVPLGPVETIEVQVAASADDAEEAATGKVGRTSTTLRLVTATTVQTVGVRFAGVDIPRRARIGRAWVQFTAAAKTTAAAALVIQGEASPAPAAYGLAAYDLSARPRTGADVLWNPPAWRTAGAAGADERTPDLAEVVQELIDQDGWQAGHALSFLLTGSGKRTAQAWDHAGTDPPRLSIEFRRPTIPIE
jgi:hypothetical protein